LDSLESALQWGKRAKNRVKKEKAVTWRGEVEVGGGEGQAEPRDIPLMLPFCCIL